MALPTTIANDDPPRAWVAVTPSDTVDVSGHPRGLYIGGAGSVNLDDHYGNTVIFAGAVAGTIIPGLIKRVRSTSTTATNLVLLY